MDFVPNGTGQGADPLRQDGSDSAGESGVFVAHDGAMVESVAGPRGGGGRGISSYDRSRSKWRRTEFG
jgi:hypothetical protein